MAASVAAPARSTAIDMLKGVAILWVLLIHSQALGGSFVFFHLVNHAVPIFIVLFGLNSELWWRRRAPGAWSEWYRNRARRIVLPVWATLAVWWGLMLALRPYGLHLSAGLLAKQLVGYLQEVGTGWFVSVIIQLVVVFPILHAVAARRGTGEVLLVGLVCGTVSIAARLWIVSAWGVYNYLVFSPRFWGHVAFGMLLANRMPRLGTGAALLAAAASLACLPVAHGVVIPQLAHYAERLLDLPLTVLLLVVLGALPWLPGVTAALVWLGQSSFGIYLGQLLVHNVLTARPRFAREIGPWGYTLALLAGALFFVWLGEAVLRLVEGLRRRGMPLPDRSR
jgi:peptidoglycan/LPS O-acetylase OafA/YrhL